MGLLIRFIFWAILTAMTPTRVEMKVLNRIGINTSVGWAAPFVPGKP